MNKEFGRVNRLPIILTFLAATLAGFWSAAWAAEPAIPKPVGYVNDFAKVIDPDFATRITAICRELDEKTGTEITVATFPDIGDGSIDDFTSKVFEQWMPGQKGIDNGILILDAIAQRQIRIEVGYGVESVIPDAVAGRIRRDAMTPFLKQEKRGEAYYQGVAALASIVAKSENVELESLKGFIAPQPDTDNRMRGRSFSPFAIFLGIAVLMAIIRRGGGGPRGRGFRGGPFIGGMFLGGLGGGGFGGGGGGGGFGGFGGGMSGGGGSSGGY